MLLYNKFVHFLIVAGIPNNLFVQRSKLKEFFILNTPEFPKGYGYPLTIERIVISRTMRVETFLGLYFIGQWILTLYLVKMNSCMWEKFVGCSWFPPDSIVLISIEASFQRIYNGELYACLVAWNLWWIGLKRDYSRGEGWKMEGGDVDDTSIF